MTGRPACSYLATGNDLLWMDVNAEIGLILILFSYHFLPACTSPFMHALYYGKVVFQDELQRGRLRPDFFSDIWYNLSSFDI